MEPYQAVDPFRTLATSIIGQQVSGRLYHSLAQYRPGWQCGIAASGMKFVWGKIGWTTRGEQVSRWLRVDWKAPH